MLASLQEEGDVIEFRVLGPLEVRDGGGQALGLGGGKQRALLALLLLHAGEVVTTERLIDALWGERPPASALNSVHIYVSQLRRALGDGQLVTRGRGYALELEPGQLDLDRFKLLLEQGRELLGAGDARAAAETLRQALALWRGPPLADFAYEPFAQTEIARLEELRLNALEERIEADLQLGRHAELVPELEALVREHPLRERLRGQLMLALYRSGRQADALEAYRQARRLLLDEFGLDPGRLLQELERGILNQEPGLDAPQRVAGALAGRRRGGFYVAVGGTLLLAAALAAAAALTRGGNEANIVSVAPDSVAVIDPETNRVVADVPVGTDPSSIAVGEDGVWVVNGNDRTVSRIDPKSKTLVRTIGTDATPSDVAAGAGAVWVANGVQNTVSRIDPNSNVVTRTIALPRPPSPSLPGGTTSFIAVGAGSVWVAAYDRGALWRIDPQTNALVATIRGDAGAIAIGEDAVWMEGYFGVSRVDPGSNTVQAKIELPKALAAVAVAGGAIWASDGSRTGLVWRIEPSRNMLASSISVGGVPSGLAAGEESLWIASSSAGTVLRVDPASEKIVATIKPGGVPVDLAVGYGLVWVAVA